MTSNKDEIMKEAGEQMRRWRIEAGLSQEEVAARARLSQFTISRIETGKNEPRGDTLMKLAKVLRKPVEQLFALYETKVPPVLTIHEYGSASSEPVVLSNVDLLVIEPGVTAEIKVTDLSTVVTVTST